MNMNIDLSFEQAQYCAEIVREKMSGLAKAAAHLENELAKVRNQSASLELIAISLERQTGGESGAILELQEMAKK